MIKSISSRYRDQPSQVEKSLDDMHHIYTHSLVEQIAADFQAGDPPFGPGRFSSFLLDFFFFPSIDIFFLFHPLRKKKEIKKKHLKCVCNGMLGFIPYRERGFCGVSHCRNATQHFKEYRYFLFTGAVYSFLMH